jgi:hypothetical protein
VIDYHVHLWRHVPHLSLRASVEQLADYCARAARLGVTELAVTASDAHQVTDIAWRISDLTAAAAAASYSEVTLYRGRNRTPQPL